MCRQQPRDLNPHSRRYDAEAAQCFYENDVHGPNVWYRDIYESASRQSCAFSVGTGRGGRGRGRGRGGFKAAADSRAVADSKVVDAATTMTTAVAVAKVITTEIKAHIMEASHKDLIIRAMGAVTTTTCTCLPYSPANKLVRPARAFTTLLCPARS